MANSKMGQEAGMARMGMNDQEMENNLRSKVQFVSVRTLLLFFRYTSFFSLGVLDSNAQRPFQQPSGRNTDKRALPGMALFI